MSNTTVNPFENAYRSTVEYSERYVAATALTLRILLGWVLFYSGITKVLDPSWTAAGYLENAVPPGNPFVGAWSVFATLPATDLLVQWGLTLTGIGLLFGAFVRWNALWAAAMMVLFWASSLPLEHAVVIDEHVVYAVVLVSLAALDAGKVAGADAYLSTTDLVRENAVLRRVVG